MERDCWQWVVSSEEKSCNRQDYDFKDKTELYTPDTVCLLAQGVRDQNFVQRLSYLVFPVVIWASFRFNRIGVPLAVLVVAIIVVVGTAAHKGPLYRRNDSHSLLQVRSFSSFWTRFCLVQVVCSFRSWKITGVSSKYLDETLFGDCFLHCP